MSHLLHDSVTHDKVDVLPCCVSLLESVTSSIGSSGQQVRVRELLLVLAFYDGLRLVLPGRHVGLVNEEFLTQLQSLLDRRILTLVADSGLYI